MSNVVKGSKLGKVLVKSLSLGTCCNASEPVRVQLFCTFGVYPFGKKKKNAFVP